MNWKQCKTYYQDNPQGYWFKRKLYGWGWTPVTWQGWAVTGGFVVLVMVIASRLPAEPTKTELIYEFGAQLLLATLGLLVIAWRTGESPRWQWGLKQPADTDDASRR